jgi:plasmid stability protein
MTAACNELAACAECNHTASMPNVLIRNLPDDVHATLQRRAASAGMSLQQYLSSELAHLARNPTMDEVLDRIRTRSGGRVGFQTAVDDLRDEREARDRR